MSTSSNLLFSDPTLHSLLLPSAVERNRWCHRGIRGGHISVSLRWTNLQSMTVLLHSVERIRSYVLVIRGLSCPFASQGFVRLQERNPEGMMMMATMETDVKMAIDKI